MSPLVAIGISFAVVLPPLGDLFPLGLLAALLVALGIPLGRFMARVYMGQPTMLSRVLGPVERGICRLGGVDSADEMPWDRYATAVIAFSIVSFLATYCLQRLQHLLPLNPAGLPPVAADSAMNTAISFMTNTNWQGYGGETTMSHGTQMLALTVQHFVSAAVGMAVFAAFVRGAARGAAHGASRCGRRTVSRDAAHRRRARGLAGGDQTAGHQRRRFFQRQLRPPTREPNAVVESP